MFNSNKVLAARDGLGNGELIFEQTYNRRTPSQLVLKDIPKGKLKESGGVRTKLRPIDGAAREIRAPFINLEPDFARSVPAGWISRCLCHVHHNRTNMADGVA
jgi:hypothetical protein